MAIDHAITEESEDEQERPLILPDMMPSPPGYTRWFDGTLYQRGWKDEDVAPLSTCKNRCYVFRYLTPGGDPDTLMAILVHDPVSHENAGRSTILDEIEQDNLKRVDILQTPNLTVDFRKQVVVADDVPIELTPTEYRLLAMLAMSYGEVVPSETIVEHLWGGDALIERRPRAKGGEYEVVGIRNLRTQIARLRNKLSSDTNRFVQIRHGLGYILVDPDDEVQRG